MAVTAQTIITQAWVDMGVGAPGDTMPTNELSNGLAKLNMLTDELSAARDLVFEILIQTFLLTNAQAFPIGSGASSPFNVTRPVKIENAKIRVGGLDHEVDIIGQKAWIDIIDKAATGTAPSKLYYDPQVPNAIINLHPIPLCSVATTLVLGTWTSINQFALASTSATLPPAYLALLNSGLKKKLKTTYGRLIDPQISQSIDSEFEECLSVVRGLNTLLEMVPLLPTGTPTTQQLATQQSVQNQ